MIRKIYSYPYCFYLIAVCCALVFGCGYWLDIMPLRQQLTANYQYTGFLKQKLQQLYYRNDSLEEKMLEFPGAKNSLIESQKNFIRRSDLKKLLKEIVALAQAEKLFIQLSDTAPVVMENHYFKQPIKIELLGNYQQITEFVTRVARLPWIVVVENFVLLKVLPDDLGQLFLLQAEFGVYFLDK